MSQETPSGPIFDFIRDDLNLDADSSNGSADVPLSQIGTILPKDEGQKIRGKTAEYDLLLGTAHFDLLLKDTPDNKRIVRLVFPSHRLQNPEEMLPFIDQLIDVAYPAEKFSNINRIPKAELDLGERKVQNDLRYFVDGERYKRHLKDPSLASATFSIDQVGIEPYNPFISRGGPTAEFVYGFYLLPYPQEAITMLYAKASSMGTDLAGEVLPRNKDYTGKNLLGDADVLSDLIIRACKEHPLQGVFDP